MSVPKRFLFFFDLDMEMNFFFNKPTQLKFNVCWQRFPDVGRPLRDLSSESHIIVRQNKLQEIVIIKIAIFIFVIKLEELIKFCFVNVVHLVLLQESNYVFCTYNVIIWVFTTAVDSFESSIRFKLGLLTKSLSLFFNECFVFRNSFEKQEQFVFC